MVAGQTSRCIVLRWSWTSSSCDRLQKHKSSVTYYTNLL